MATTDVSVPAFGDAGLSTDIPTIVAAAVMALPFASYDNPDIAAERHGKIQEVVLQALASAGVSARGFPLTLTPDLLDVLGMPNFRACPMAHAFREAGRAEIKRRSEDEQAFVLHWLTTLVLEHGADWRRVAGETMQPVIEEAKAAIAARDAERAAKDAGRPEP
ncbi:hypothetical protein MKK75_12655 [Methylobacterium sp. J-030]|uniref:hypothetical protein n=1 Tax=Methylobacterium sp. J-030 TaxID=2836627 RepID=UPI001FB8F500|nr:hypothetical protein [Methylobacterium sp. J-030]MCJ2069629.1 hypothetical protein [Methylobacterium sp. J-030]